MLLATVAPAAPLKTGTIDLDASHPLIDVRVAGVALRLRVDPGQWDAVELNPAAAARLPLAFEPGMDVEVGRLLLAGRVARAELVVAGRKRPVQIASHARPVTDDADGVIGPDLLPFATVTWRSATAPAPTGRIVLPLTADDSIGPTAPGPVAPARVRFSLLAAASDATAAAGGLIGGRFEGGYVQRPAAYGLTRPVRVLIPARPIVVAGFAFDRLVVRVADFRGREQLPADPPQADEIAVTAREHAQHGVYWILLGRDHLSRCAEIVYRDAPRSLELACAFD